MFIRSYLDDDDDPLCRSGAEGVPVQVDGEAWLQPPGCVCIQHKNRTQILCRNRQFESSLKSWNEKQRRPSSGSFSLITWRQCTRALHPEPVTSLSGKWEQKETMSITAYSPLVVFQSAGSQCGSKTAPTTSVPTGTTSAIQVPGELGSSRHSPLEGAGAGAGAPAGAPLAASGNPLEGPLSEDEVSQLSSFIDAASHLVKM